MRWISIIYFPLVTTILYGECINPFMYNVEKWQNTSKFLKVYFAFFNIMYESLKFYELTEQQLAIINSYHRLNIGKYYEGKR